MTISQSQAESFVNRTKSGYLAIANGVKALQAIAIENEQEVTAWGGGAAITDAIPANDWNAAYPFTKAEFLDILSNFASCGNVLATHGDLATNLTKLRE